jgi:transposase
MLKDMRPGKPTTRRYSDREKADAVRMVRALRAELGSEHGTEHYRRNTIPAPVEATLPSLH